MSGPLPDVGSPRVLTSRWGQLVVEGLGDLTDAKLWPGGGRAWDWTETGTHTDPASSPPMSSSCSITTRR